MIGDDAFNNENPSFGTGSESEKDLGRIKDLEGVTELGRLHRGLEAAEQEEEESQVGDQPVLGSEPVLASVLGEIKEVSDDKTNISAGEDGVQDEDIDPSVLKLITVPITDPV